MRYVTVAWSGGITVTAFLMARIILLCDGLRVHWVFLITSSDGNGYRESVRSSVQVSERGTVPELSYYTGMVGNTTTLT
jgi:hypothetical protein